jgi:hypothetical protein
MTGLQQGRQDEPLEKNETNDFKNLKGEKKCLKNIPIYLNR